MIDAFLAHLDEFVVDLIIVVLAAIVFAVYRTRAARVMLVNYIFILVAAYTFLSYVRFHYSYNVPYFLASIVYTVAVVAFVSRTVPGHALLKWALWLNVVWLGVGLGREPLQQMAWVSPDMYTVTYDRYPTGRIMIVSFQILGLIIPGAHTHGRHRSFNMRVLRRVSRFVVSVFPPARCVLRVEKT